MSGQQNLGWLAGKKSQRRDVAHRIAGQKRGKGPSHWQQRVRRQTPPPAFSTNDEADAGEGKNQCEAPADTPDGLDDVGHAGTPDSVDEERRPGEGGDYGDETLAALVVVAAIAVRALRGTWDPARGARPRWRERIASVRDEARRFSGGHPDRLWRVFALDLAFHAVAVVEVYITLEWLLGTQSPTVIEAIVFEALNRVITVAFKFVPFRVGIDEVSAGALAPILSMNPAAGVALAVVRKVRNLFWAAIGLALVAAHPAENATITKTT